MDVIKFKLDFVEGPAPEHSLMKDMNDLRTDMFRKKLIGVTEDGIGYGNVSIRSEGNHFVTTGTQTGGKAELNFSDYALITFCDIDKNEVACTGKVKASSEAMSHAAVYVTNSEVNCVIHTHNQKLWQYLLDNGFPRTDKNAEYGTVEIAHEIVRIVKEMGKEGIFAMEGHEDGVISYGPDIETANRILLEKYQESL